MDWIVLLPPVIAICSRTVDERSISVSPRRPLARGQLSSWVGIPCSGLRELVDQMVAVFQSASNTRILLFSLLVGGLIALVQASGGVLGFINWAQARGWGSTRRSAELLAWSIGMIVFVESSITCLIVGSISRPLFDRLKLPREKLAYYCDATSAPVCMMIPLNGWGAFVLGLLGAQGLAAGAVGLLTESLIFNFYAIFAIVFSLVLALTGWRFSSMETAEKRAEETGQLMRPGATPLVSEDVIELPPVDGSRFRASHLLVPIGVMVVMIFAGLLITGEGNLMAGSGSTAVLWAVLSAVAAAMILYALPGSGSDGKPLMKPVESMALVLKGSSGAGRNGGTCGVRLRAEPGVQGS